MVYLLACFFQIPSALLHIRLLPSASYIALADLWKYYAAAPVFIKTKKPAAAIHSE
jgi:hypothetical protein